MIVFKVKASTLAEVMVARGLASTHLVSNPLSRQDVSAMPWPYEKVLGCPSPKCGRAMARIRYAALPAGYERYWHVVDIVHIF